MPNFKTMIEGMKAKEEPQAQTEQHQVTEAKVPEGRFLKDDPYYKLVADKKPKAYREHLFYPEGDKLALHGTAGERLGEFANEDEVKKFVDAKYSQKPNPVTYFKPLSKEEGEDMRKRGMTEDEYRYKQASDRAILMGEQIPDKNEYMKGLAEKRGQTKQKPSMNSGSYKGVDIVSTPSGHFIKDEKNSIQYSFDTIDKAKEYIDNAEKAKGSMFDQSGLVTEKGKAASDEFKREKGIKDYYSLSNDQFNALAKEAMEKYGIKDFELAQEFLISNSQDDKGLDKLLEIRRKPRQGSFKQAINDISKAEQEGEQPLLNRRENAKKEEEFEKLASVSSAFADNGEITINTPWTKSQRNNHKNYLELRSYLDENYGKGNYAIDYIQDETRDNGRETSAKLKVRLY